MRPVGMDRVAGPYTKRVMNMLYKRFRRRKAYRAGFSCGRGAGAWVIDGNTSDEQKAAIVKGYDDGAIVDLCPSPLSGEWAGESIPELSEQYEVDLSDDDKATDFEDGFVDGFWREVLRAAKGGAR